MERTEGETTHKSVLLPEVLNAFQLNVPLKKSVKIIDATLGLGGHTLALVKRGASVLGIDADLEMLKLAEKKLSIACPIPEDVKDFRGLWKLRHGNFNDIDKIAETEGFSKVDGILMDLGVSSPQITSGERGISFRNDEASLDMRLDRDNQNILGKDLLNALRPDQIRELFETVLKRNKAIKLTGEIVKARSDKAIETVGDFKQIISRVLKKKKLTEVYTLPFMALRIAVNSELDVLKEGLTKSLGLLDKRGRLVVISFHSGEDRIVKRVFKQAEEEGNFRIVNGLITPGNEELDENPRARSAKMRIIEKI